MRRRISHLIITLLLTGSIIAMTGCSAAQTDSTTTPTPPTSTTQENLGIKPPKTAIPVKVVRDVDGDTIKIMYQGKEESVRFLLIDTPETHHPKLGVQPWGKDAAAFTTDKIMHAKEVEIEFSGPERDKYHRLLAYVYVDGRMLNDDLVKAGLARVAYVYQKNPPHYSQIMKDMYYAQRHKLNIWSVDGYVQKDGFHPEVIKPAS